LTRSASRLVDRIDALLPQTQCRQCGYAGCRPYAEAVAAGSAAINQCAPGGDDGVRELATLLGVSCAPVDPRFGATKPPAVAIIDESLCIGCTLCIEACPVDAIVGAAKLMHTVIARDCTGCELCIPPCPVDCISMAPTGRQLTRAQLRDAADAARLRFLRREARLNRERHARRPGSRATTARVDQRIVQRALERARRRLAQTKPPET
jgi:electron transport complex protein RnfB